MNYSLSGKTALITGGSGGIGRKIAFTLAEAGADIILHYYRDEESALAVKAEIETCNRSCFVVQADLRKEESVFAMQKEVKKNFKMPDILCLNAVVQYEWHTVEEQNLSDFYSQYESCVLQTVLMTKAFVPYLKAQKYGKIVITNTECSYRCDAGTGAYVAGKAGLNGLAKVLAKELGPYQINVNQVSPGWVVTDKERQKGVCQAPEYVQTVPLCRRGCDQDIANAFLFLASEESSFITGENIHVTGGR